MGANNGATANVWVMTKMLIADLLSNDVERQPKANAATCLSLSQNTFTAIAMVTMAQCGASILRAST